MKKFRCDSFIRAYELKGNVTICRIKSDMVFNGKKFVIDSKGKAVCNPSDKFDKDFGEALAVSRAEYNYNHKCEKALIQYSNKNNPLKKAEEAMAKISNGQSLNQIINKKLDELIKLLGRSMNGIK